jgi:hypothetical protein
MGFFFPDPPTFDDSMQRAADERLRKEQEEKDRIEAATIARKRGGYGGTILTSGMGVTDEAPAVQTLLGGSSENVV